MDGKTYTSGDASLFAVMARTARSSWLDDFRAWLEANPTRKQRGRSELTVDAYVGDARQFATFLEQCNGQGFEPGLLNSIDVKAFFKNLEGAGKPATYNRKLASMRMLIGWAREMGMLDYDPAAWIPFQDATRESPRDVQPDEWARLEMAAEAGRADLLGLRDLLIFRLMGSAGLRIHEAVELRLDDLHLEDGYIHVLGKGQKHRKVRVGGKLVKVIREWMERMPKSVDGTLVTDMRGRSIDRITAWRRFELIAQAAGVACTPHALRHTYIYRFMDAIMAGDQGKLPAAIDAVCQQTGDRPEVILQYYTRARESDLRAVAEVM